MTTRRLTIGIFLVEGFDEGLDAATVPRWLWSCGAEPTGERAEYSSIGACRGQPDANAGGPLHDARSDLDQPKAQRVELRTSHSSERLGAAARSV